MAEEKREKKKPGGCLAVFFLFLLFVSAVAIGAVLYAEKRLASPEIPRMAERYVQEETGMRLSIGGYRYLPPKDFELKEVSVKTPGGSVFRFNSLNISLKPVALLAGEARVTVSAQSGGGSLHIRLDRDLEGSRPLVARLWINDYPLERIINNPDREPLPITARVKGTGLLNIPGKDPGNLRGNLAFRLLDVEFRPDAFMGSKAFRDNDKQRKQLLEKLKVDSAECAVAVSDGVLSDRGCRARTSYAFIQARFSEKVKNLLDRGALNVGLDVFDPQGELALYLMLTRQKRQDGSYLIPLTLYFKERPEGTNGEQ